eukprot:10731709-Lingulodinium_polyedra.AAC.1
MQAGVPTSGRVSSALAGVVIAAGSHRKCHTARCRACGAAGFAQAYSAGADAGGKSFLRELWM